MSTSQGPDEAARQEREKRIKRQEASMRVDHYTRTLLNDDLTEEKIEYVKNEIAGMLERANLNATALLKQDLPQDEKENIEALKETLDGMMEDYSDMITEPQIYVERAKRAQKEGNIEEEIGYYDKALDSDPTSFKALFRKGLALGELGRDEEAKDCFDRLTELDPGYALAWANKGSASLEMGEYEEALECFENAIELDPDSEAWYGKGKALVELGRHDEAEKAFEKFIELNPKSKRRDEVESWLEE